MGRPPEVTCRRQDRGERRPWDFGETKNEGGRAIAPQQPGIFERAHGAGRSISSWERRSLWASCSCGARDGPKPSPDARPCRTCGRCGQRERRPEPATSLRAKAVGDRRRRRSKALFWASPVSPGSARAAPAEERLSPSFAFRSVFGWEGLLKRSATSGRHASPPPAGKTGDVDCIVVVFSAWSGIPLGVRGAALGVRGAVRTDAANGLR